jgi:predicted transcriptional regulator
MIWYYNVYMKSKYEERTRAVTMRKLGMTIPNIASELGVSKSSVSLWLQGITLPSNAKRILNERKVRSRLLANSTKRNSTLSKLKGAKAEAHVLTKSFKLNSCTALVSCALMYWCEGSKSKNDAEFTFTNAEPLLVQGFLSLLRMSLPLNESKFRVKMHLHKYHDESAQKKFWSEVTRIPIVQFQNTYWKKNSEFNIKPGYQGCVHVRYHDVTVARKISAVARNFLKSISMIE